MEREILLFSQIEPATVAQVDQWLSALEAAGARTGTMRINSPGGSWHAGQLIRSRMLMSKIAVTTVNEGLVGSAATLPYAAGKVRQCQPHATFMMHEVSNDVGFVNATELTKALQAQQALNRSTAEMYAAISSVSADEWVKQMATEKWCDAQAAKQIGFCTQVLPGSMAAPDASMSVTDMHKYYMSLIVGHENKTVSSTEAGIEWLKKAIALHEKHMNGTAPTTGKAGEESQMLMMEQMKKALAALTDTSNSGTSAAKPMTMKIDDVRNALKLAGVTLADNATEADALAAIGKLKNQTAGPAPKKDDEEESELEKLRKRLDVMEQSRTNEQTATIENTVNSAISAGKITASQKDTYVGLLKADFTNASKVLGELPGRTSVASRMGQPRQQVDTTRNDWGFEKWSKEDAAGLRELKQADPDKYQNLLDTYTA